MTKKRHSREYNAIRKNLLEQLQRRGALTPVFVNLVNDYMALMFIIFATVLIMASAVSLLSALAKDVKNAGTMITPFMLVVMVAGLLPLMQDGATESLASYAIPFYNSIETFTAIFAHKLQWSAVLITVASNVVYTGVAVWGLTKMFNSEKVMFSK